MACWRVGVLVFMACWRVGVLACWRVGVLACNTLNFDVQYHILRIVVLELALQTAIFSAGGS